MAYRYDYQELRDQAQGRWSHILASLAPELESALDKAPRHVPCPVHGGKDGFRLYRDYEDNGGAVCNLGVLRLRDSTFLSNSVYGGLGGTGASGQLVTEYYAIPAGPGGPGGAGNGGGVFNAGVGTLINCSFTGNIGRGGNGGTGGQGYANYYPPPHWGAGGNGGSGGKGGSACGAICDINALCTLTNCVLSWNSSIKGFGGSGGAGGFGNPYGANGALGPEGEAFGSLRSIGAIVMNTVLTGNSPGGNCFGTFTDGGGNVSSDGSCGFTNPHPIPGGAAALPPFYLVRNFTAQEDSYADAHPFGALVAAPDGRLFGVTIGDNWEPAGAVYQVRSNGAHSSFGVVRAFGNNPNHGPAGTLVLAGEMLFGTSRSDGQSNMGTIYRIRTDGSDYQILHSFTGGTNGGGPHAGLVLSGSTLYGTGSGGIPITALFSKSKPTVPATASCTTSWGEQAAPSPPRNSRCPGRRCMAPRRAADN